MSQPINQIQGFHAQTWQQACYQLQQQGQDYVMATMIGVLNRQTVDTSLVQNDHELTEIVVVHRHAAGRRVEYEGAVVLPIPSDYLSAIVLRPADAHFAANRDVQGDGATAA